jgi:antitoxin CptB
MQGRSDLRWRCRRGTRELDLLLSAYMERAYESATPVDQARFAELLERRDVELQAIFFGNNAVDDTLGDLPARILALASFSS